jgi:hypothetical protein
MRLYIWNTELHIGVCCICTEQLFKGIEHLFKGLQVFLNSSDLQVQYNLRHMKDPGCCRE